MPENTHPDDESAEHALSDAVIAEESDEQDAPEGEEQERSGPPVKADGSPYTQADIDALNEALRKARQAERKLKRGGQRVTQGQDESADPDQVRSEAETAAAARWKPVVVQQAARSAFAEAGLILPKSGGDEAMRRVLRLLDLDDIDVTDDGAVEGLAEQVEDIKRDWPDLFAAPAARNGRPPRVSAGNRDGATGQTPRSAADQIAAALLTGRGR